MGAHGLQSRRGGSISDHEPLKVSLYRNLCVKVRTFAIDCSKFIISPLPYIVPSYLQGQELPLHTQKKL